MAMTIALIGYGEVGRILSEDLRARGESVTTTLAFSVGASPPIRLVCKPAADSVPVSATWKVD